MDFILEVPIDCDKKSDEQSYEYITVCLPNHADKRARERYGLFLDPKTTRSLYNTIFNGPHSIELSEGTCITQKDGTEKYRPGIRYACVFRKEWRLVVCHADNGIILTFLEPSFIKQEEKQKLKGYRHYFENACRSDPFGVWPKR